MMNLESIPIQAFLIVSSALFCIGIWGLLNSRNAVRVLMSIELMLNAVNINLMAFSSYIDNNLVLELNYYQYRKRTPSSLYLLH